MNSNISKNNYKKFNTSHIIISQSNLHGAGMGAFACVDIEANKKLGQYIGEKLTEDEASDLECQTYIFEVYDKINGNFFLNAHNFNKSNWTRFINSCKNIKQRKLINAKFYQKDHKIWVKSIKNINKGEEIIADYGDYYW